MTTSSAMTSKADPYPRAAAGENRRPRRPTRHVARAARPWRSAGAPEPGLSEQARARLEEMIVSLELAPGSIWSEAELSAKLGIGRTPVREALQRLEGDHLVRNLPRHGAQITEINVVEQLLLLELRRDLDRSIAPRQRAAARRRSGAKLLEMAERLEARLLRAMTSFPTFATTTS